MADSGKVPADRAAEIAGVMAALTAVWFRNPGKSLMQILDRALRDTNTFTPFDATDQQVTSGLNSITPR